MNTHSLRHEAPWALWVLALLGVSTHIVLLCGASIAAWMLPVALVIAAGIHAPCIPRLGHPAVIALTVIGFIVIAYGSIATLDRSWDGLATWTANARWLSLDGSLKQPYFTDLDVFHYARGYPLLQPILLALGMQWFGEHGARLLFPLLWMLLVLGLPDPLRRAGLSGRPLWLAIAGLLLVPFFLEPGGGGADSGFADLLVAALLLYAAIGLAEDRAGLMACACVLLPMAKVEGTVHVVNFVFAAAFWARSRGALGGALGGSVGLACSLPLYQLIRAPDSSLNVGSLWLALTPFAALFIGAAMRGRRTRWVALVACIPVLAMALGSWDASNNALLQTISHVLRIEIQFDDLPGIVWHSVQALVQVKQFGLTFVLMIATSFVVASRVGLGPLRALIVVQALGMLAIFLFLIGRSSDRLDLFLREGLIRYVAQWLGVAWLMIGLGWARLQVAARTTTS